MALKRKSDDLQDGPSKVAAREEIEYTGLLDFYATDYDWTQPDYLVKVIEETKHLRPSLLTEDEEGNHIHVYAWQGHPIKQKGSVSAFVKKVFPFNGSAPSPEVQQQWDNAAIVGTKVHKHIEDFLAKLRHKMVKAPKNTKEWKMFAQQAVVQYIGPPPPSPCILDFHAYEIFQRAFLAMFYPAATTNGNEFNTHLLGSEVCMHVNGYSGTSDIVGYCKLRIHENRVIPFNMQDPPADSIVINGPVIIDFKTTSKEPHSLFRPYGVTGRDDPNIHVFHYNILNKQRCIEGYKYGLMRGDDVIYEDGSSTRGVPNSTMHKYWFQTAVYSSFVYHHYDIRPRCIILVLRITPEGAGRYEIYPCDPLHQEAFEAKYREIV